VNGKSSLSETFWRSKPLALFFVFLVLGITLFMPGIGVIPAFAIALVAALMGRKAGSFAEMGFRSPDSWTKLLVTTFGYGLVLQMVSGIVVEPLLAKLTGTPVDISVMDPVRGSLVNYLIMTVVGWTVGAFLEEFTFRGFVVTRTRASMRGGSAAVWFGVIVAAVVFGLAHQYQGPSGMIVTGLAGLIFGAMYVDHKFNLWYPIFTHGFVNTIAMILIYLDIDHELAELLF